jgi:hypothetical protein
MQMPKEFHTINEGIPREGRQIGMDTLQNREGLHVWIRLTPKSRRSISVYLTRQDAHNLIEEIKHRLF